VIGTNVARRYAKAIFEIGVESSTLPKIVEEVATLADAYGSKKAILSEIAEKAGVSTDAKHALLLILDRRRLHALPAVSQILRELSDAKQGVLRAEVTTAVRLSEGYYQKLQAQLEKMTGQRVALDRHEDPSILAGVIARIGDRVYDGSLRTRLTELGNSLLPN
jgi:F-type H+-transporting ATPase subunit delta